MRKDTKHGRHRNICVVIFMLFLSIPVLVIADADSQDSSPDSILSSADISELLELIDGNQAQKAIDRLKTIVENDDKNADTWNLLGYGYRKLELYDQSAEAYRNALDLDPQHKGALEYQGELFLVLGDSAGANSNLLMLEALCPTGCHELDDLQEALDASL